MTRGEIIGVLDALPRGGVFGFVAWPYVIHLEGGSLPKSCAAVGALVTLETDQEAYHSFLFRTEGEAKKFVSAVTPAITTGYEVRARVTQAGVVLEDGQPPKVYSTSRWNKALAERLPFTDEICHKLDKLNQVPGYGPPHALMIAARERKESQHEYNHFFRWMHQKKGGPSPSSRALFERDVDLSETQSFSDFPRNWRIIHTDLIRQWKSRWKKDRLSEDTFSLANAYHRDGI